MNRLVLPHPPRVGFTLLLLLGLGLLGMQWAHQWTSDTEPNAEIYAAQAELWELSSALAMHQQQALTQIDARLRALAGLSLVSTAEMGACNRLLARQLETLPGVENLLVLNNLTRGRCYAHPVNHALLQDYTQLSSAMMAQHALLPIVHADKILFAAPLQNAAGQTEGHLLAIAPLASWLRPSQLAIPATLSLSLLDQTGKVLVTEERAAAGLHRQALPSAGVSTGIAQDGSEYWQATVPLGGAARGMTLAARQTVPNTFLETATALLGILSLSLLMLITFATFKFSTSVHGAWWQSISNRLKTFGATHSLQRLRKLVSTSKGESTVMLLRRSNTELKSALAAQEARARQLQRLDQLNQMLVSSTSQREAAKAVAQCAQELLPHTGGALLLRTRPGVVEKAVSWGACAQHEFSRPADCWAQRLGYTYVVSQPPSAVCCTHLSNTDAPVPYVCVPLIAQGELLGTLHIQSAEAPAIWLAESLAQRSAGAISRIQREALLRAQATRDPLTGLHNRRFLEESLSLEQTRAKRHGTPIGLMVLDVDHFKRFNDTFGHDAGDALLRAMGRTIRSQVRKGDIPCRYGGEEFVIVLPEADLDITFARAEALRQAVSELQVTHDGQALGPVTISIGVACYPRHGSNCRSVLKVADQALYAGKNAGRNRVMRPTPMLVSSN